MHILNFLAKCGLLLVSTFFLCFCYFLLSFIQKTSKSSPQEHTY
ncbi:hypothetical protein WZ342_2609 [Enterococcus faecalis]|nr:hypothetical protein WZ342_2609 [Enterococcus faecalis]